MTSIMTMLTGGGDAAKAQKLAEEQRKVDQARQLATMNEESQRTALVRRNPRGRRLLADAATSTLPDVVA